MPLFAHLGIGFAAKRAAPKIPIWALLLSAMGPDLLAIPLVFLPDMTWFHHGLIMGVIWSLVAMLLTAVVIKYVKKDENSKLFINYTCIIIGLLVFSHWILDFIGWPMSAFDPTATGIPLFFNDIQLTGLGVYSNIVTAIIMDLGVFIVGLVIYILTIKKLKNEKS